jgi:trans-aconitate 2-methyltransferase
VGWDPNQYDRYAAERRQPFHDLVALLPARPDRRIVDLGCGTGELTKVLHETTAARSTLGVDSSPSMLAKSAALSGAGLSFALRDIADVGVADGPFDLVFSNAALHWVHDHDELFPRLVSMLAPGGELAVQVPANHEHPSHTVAAEVALEAPFRDRFPDGPWRPPVLQPAAYARLLHRLGMREQHVRLQVYAHELPGRDDVVEWVKGTLLTHYEQRVGPERWARFLERYRERLFGVLPDDAPFLFPFARILMWGRMPGG